ncbi:hypothetical protein BHE74_00048940, partial [Ensete ventricosum]
YLREEFASALVIYRARPRCVPSSPGRNYRGSRGEFRDWKAIWWVLGSVARNSGFGGRGFGGGIRVRRDDHKEEPEGGHADPEAAESFSLEVLGAVAIAAALGFPHVALGFGRWLGGEDAAGAADAMAASWCSEVSCCSGEMDSVSWNGRIRERERTREAPPPVVRTSRGLAQMLPSRFNDSVLIDPWKKEKP